VAPRDARAIEDAVAGVELVAPRLEVEAYKIMAAGASAEAKVLGVSRHERQLGHLVLAQGRFLDELDEQEHAQVCVIGPRVARDLFGYEPAVGRQLKINDVWCEVVGVLQDSGSTTSFEGIDVGRTSEEIYLPVTTALRKFDRDPLAAPLDEIVVRLAAGVSPGGTAAAVRSLLERLHSGADDFELVVPEALLEQSRRTQRLFNIVMGCIAGISLLVGGIGIMNIMLATVLERTREIGVRRASGARRADIRRQFIIEAFSISVLGGLAGVVVGTAIARAVAAMAGWPTVVTATSVALSTGVSLTVGLVSGLYPALRAAELDPIEALRYE
jgi:putative ABC transport system permease protein